MTSDLPDRSDFSAPDGHAGDLLSAHVDGELAGPAATWVRAHLDECEACAAVAAEAAAARDWVRALPPVDATPLVDGLLARHRSAIRLGAGFVAAAAVALAALALSSAVIRTDVVPDLDRLIAAHATTAPQVGPADSRADELHDSGMAALGGARRVESVGRPYSAPPAMMGNRASLSRRAIFDGSDLAVIVYSDGESTVSVFQQPGRLRWDLLPAGQFEDVGRRRVWFRRTAAEHPTVVVTEAGHVVITVVADDAAAALTVLDGLPDVARGSAWEHIHDACSRLTEVFAIGG